MSLPRNPALSETQRLDELDLPEAEGDQSWSRAIWRTSSKTPGAAIESSLAPTAGGSSRALLRPRA
jgi:hypothetical protein